MSTRPVRRLVLFASTLAVALALAGCTPGGQFDPTELLAADPFGTKKKLQGDREPLFPTGVPGAQTGVPPDLVKGYQPPPEQAAADNGDAAAKPVAAAAAESKPKAEAKPKPKPKPKPKLARAPAAAPAAHDPAWDQKAASTPQQQHDPIWDQKAASPQQPVWPAAPSAAPAQQTAQPAQPAQSIWPNPPASSTPSR